MLFIICRMMVAFWMCMQSENVKVILGMGPELPNRSTTIPGNLWVCTYTAHEVIWALPIHLYWVYTWLDEF